MASEEGLTIKDVDLVFVFAFDLGDKVDAKKLGEAFAKTCSLIEGIWYAHGKPDSRLHAFLRAMIANDEATLNPEYLKMGRYVRLKLVELEAEVVEPNEVEAYDREIQEYMRKILGRCRIDPYLLIHNTGIGVVTAWINLKDNFTTDDIITLEKRFKEVKLNIKDRCGHQFKSVTLVDFIRDTIAAPLQRMVKGVEELRNVFVTGHVIIGVKDVKCCNRCFTAVDIVKEHVKEVAGILSRSVAWRDYRIEAAEEALRRGLSHHEHYALYLTIGASLFLGSPKLSKSTEEEVAKSQVDRDTAFRLRMLDLVIAVEFLMLSVKILDVYDSYYREKIKELQEKQKEDEVVNPSEYIELRRELTDALEEYRNIEFFIVDPPRGILEYGKELYRLTQWESMLRSALDELAELTRTQYDERFARSQLFLTIALSMFGIFAGAVGILSMSASFFGVIEFFEKLYGLQMAFIWTMMVIGPLVGIYLIISIYIYKRYIVPLYKEFERPLRKVAKNRKTRNQNR
jgi:hypothetical protein